MQSSGGRLEAEGGLPGKPLALRVDVEVMEVVDGLS